MQLLIVSSIFFPSLVPTLDAIYDRVSFPAPPKSQTKKTEKMENQTIQQLKATLVNASGKEQLSLRFRALFSLKALGSAGDTEAIDAIAQGFKDDSELLKHELAYVLGQTGQYHAIQYLTQVLEDQNQQPMVRHEAAEALGAIGSSASLPLLSQYRDSDPLEIVRQTCELAIDRINWQSSESSRSEHIQKSSYSSVDPAPSLPSTNDTRSEVTKLTAELNNTALSLFNRYRAMFRLRDIGSPEAVYALASGFKDTSALFRHEIAYVFGQMSDPLSVPALIEVLRNTNEEGMVRHEAAEALGSIATDEVLPVLAQFARDAERVVRESCVVATDMFEYERSGHAEYAYLPQAVAV